MTRPSWFHLKDTRGWFSMGEQFLICHLNRLKSRHHMFTWIGAEEAFDRVKHEIRIKALNKIGTKRDIFQCNKGCVQEAR